jgi:hypothetical protein
MNGRRQAGKDPDAGVLDRREFIGAASAFAATVLLPASAVAVPPAAQAPRATLADWTIDDMWGVYSRYADPIGYGRPRGDRPVAVDPVDAGLVD